MKPLTFLLFSLVACKSDPTDDTATAPTTDDTAVTDTGTADSERPWWEDDPGDADGDGITAAEGDCDDTDPLVHPGQNDDPCNGYDDDCDGMIDEDLAPDTHEPNDAAATWLGDLTDVPEVIVHGYLHPDTDVDRFAFYVEDEDFGYFDLEGWLYSVPLQADYTLELMWVADAAGAPQGIVEVSDQAGAGGYELINYGGAPGRDDSGWYELIVRSAAGSGCSAPYTLQILVGGW